MFAVGGKVGGGEVFVTLDSVRGKEQNSRNDFSGKKGRIHLRVPSAELGPQMDRTKDSGRVGGEDL